MIPCPNDITAQIKEKETTANIIWINPRGVTVSMNLDEGKHNFYYSLQDGRECQFSVTVKGMHLHYTMWDC